MTIIRKNEMEISKEELDHIIRDAIAKSEDEKWNAVKFMKGWINHKFLAFVIVTWRINILLDKRLAETTFSPTALDLAIVIIWGVVVVAFIFGRSLDIAVESMKLSAELKAGASINKEIKTGGKK